MTEKTPKQMVEPKSDSGKFSEVNGGFIKHGGLNLSQMTPRPPAPTRPVTPPPPPPAPQTPAPVSQTPKP